MPYNAASSRFPCSGLLLLTVLCLLLHVDVGVHSMRCTDSRTWRCLVRGMHRVNETIPSELLEDADAAPYDITYTYMIKVNPEQGRLYTSGRLRWQIKPSWLGNTTTLNVYITPLNGTAETSIFLLEAAGKQDRRYRPESSVDFYIHIADILQLGHAYKIAVTADSSNFTGTSIVKLPPQIEDEVDCELAVAKGETLRTQQAARFSILYRELMVYPSHAMINISFYGAPHAYCIQSYDVQLYLEDLLLVKSHKIPKQDMIMENGFPVGVTAFNGVEKEKNYTIRIVPNSYFSNWTGCVCSYNGNCGCITTVSAMFSFPGLQSVPDERPPNDEEQLVRIHLLEEEEADKNHDILYLVVSILLLALTVFFLALIVLLLFQRRITLRHKGNLLLIRGGVDQLEDIRKPLIRSGAVKPASVLLLVDDYQRSDVAEALAKLLQGGGVRVRYMLWERDLVEQSVSHWVQNVLTTVDKILLCHTEKAADIISGKYASELGLFDDIFREIYSALKYSDPKLVHVRMDRCRLLLPLNAELIYSVPSNLIPLFDSLKIPLAKADVFAFEKLYNNTDNEVRSKKEEANELETCHETTVPHPMETSGPAMEPLHAPEVNSEQLSEPVNAESEQTTDHSISGYYTNDFSPESDTHPHDLPMIDGAYIDRKKSVERESVRSDSGIIT